MSDRPVILVTGVAGYWGYRVASRLAAEPDLHVIGLDIDSPPEDVPGLDFIRADVRNPLMVELLASEGVEAVCHLKFAERIEHNQQVFEQNVVGTAKLLDACAHAGVARIVLKSSMAVYGAHRDNSAFLSEEMPLRGSRSYAYTRDLLDIEAHCNGFRAQGPKTDATILRFASIIGLGCDTPMTRFLKQRSPFTLLGFDPVMQLIHEKDVVEALIEAVSGGLPGVFNVAAEGAMPLSRILRLAGRLPRPIPHPLAYKGLDLLRGTGYRPTRFVPIEWDYLRYSWLGDLTRMHDQVGFQPLYMADEALREFASGQPKESDGPPGEAAFGDSELLGDIIERRNRARERQTATEETEEQP